MTVKNNKRTVFGWAMYDWANSAYSTTTVGALMPAYFAAVVVGEDGWNFGGTNYLADEIWGYATGIVIFIFFLIMPIFGAMADMSGSKMKFLKIFAYGGSVFATVMFFLTAGDVWLTLFLYLGAQFGFVGSLVFNDANVFGFDNPILSFYLFFAGFMTLVPLFMYIKGFELIGIGPASMIFFLTPTAQFFLSIFYLGQPLEIEKLISFLFIWIAVIIYLNELRKE